MSEEFAMSQFATKKDREQAINKRIVELAKKRDIAVDIIGKPFLGWSYQIEIDKLAQLLEPVKEKK